MSQWASVFSSNFTREYPNNPLEQWIGRIGVLEASLWLGPGGQRLVKRECRAYSAPGFVGLWSTDARAVATCDISTHTASRARLPDWTSP